MKADLSRPTFDADKHFNAVLMQQGRVNLDADWNEQQAIHRHRAEAATADVVGPTGAPRVTAGFSLTPQAGDILIGAGHFYVDGVLCENPGDVLFSAQPDLPSLGGPALPATDGLYLAYLEVWDRHITALEDPQIRETALGGPDTTTRTRTVWQVRLLPVADPGGTPGPETDFPEWTQLLGRNLIGISDPGRMRARSEPDSPTPDPLCVLPPAAGYRSLENQLYRVEVHRGGDRATARFKWSRDNGTVASAIEPDANGVVVRGSVIEVAEIGKDGTLSFASEPLPQWLELTDDRFELLGQHGTLARVQDVDPVTRTITFAPGPLPVLDAAFHPVVRRWDQTGAGPTGDGVPMTGAWQPLENGVQVLFENGVYREGDFWQIPARTAIGFDTGHIEWPRDASVPRAVAPRGTRHRFARLGLLRRQGGTMTVVNGGDWRPVFPPLTAITAADVSYDDTANLVGAGTVQSAIEILAQRNGSNATLVVGPGDDLAAALATLKAKQHALVCLRAGTYTLPSTIRVSGLGHLQFVGAGPGTRLVAATAESAISFTSCDSVTASDMTIEAGAPGRGTAANNGLNGSLAFVDCPSVVVERVTAQCAGGPIRAAACVSVRNTAQRGTRLRIESCTLLAGHHQVGIIAVNVDSCQVNGNSVRVQGRPGDALLLQDVDYRASIRRQIMSHLSLPRPGNALPPNTNASVTFGGSTVHLLTDPRLVFGSRTANDWQRAITATNPPGVTSPRALTIALRNLASRMVQTRGTGAGGSASLRTVMDSLVAQDFPAMDQGIVLSGTLGADTVRIAGNTVVDAVQGIHAAYGADTSGVSGVVAITDNTVRVALPSSASRERHGVFVGNTNSLQLEDNYISLVRASRNAALRIEGVRIAGLVGRRVVVRQNHLGPQYAVGITFAPFNAALPAQPLWMITENVMESATTKVDVPPSSAGRPGTPDPNGVRARIIGLSNNFA